MPVDTRIESIPQHLIAEWNTWDDDGNMKMEAISPNDVLYLIAEGMTTGEIAAAIEAPRKAVEHVIMGIPEMMYLREKALESQGVALDFSALAKGRS